MTIYYIMDNYTIITMEDFHKMCYLPNRKILDHIYKTLEDPKNDHDLDQDAINIYILSSIERLRYTFLNIIRQFRYVSYKEFLENFEQTIIRANNILTKQYFIYSCDRSTNMCIEKSNFFILLLLFDVLENHPELTSIKNNIKCIFIGSTENFINKFSNYAKQKNLDAIFIDDCAYSGMQLSYHMTSCKWKNNIVIIPYISLKAFDIIKVSNYENTVDFIYNQVIQNIDTGLLTGYFMLDKHNNLMTLNKYFNFRNNQASWYFQHKFADYVSIPNTFLTTATIIHYVFYDEYINNIDDKINNYLRLSPINMSDLRQNYSKKFIIPMTNPFIHNFELQLIENTNHPVRTYISLIKNCRVKYDELGEIIQCKYNKTTPYKNVRYENIDRLINSNFVSFELIPELP